MLHERSRNTAATARSPRSSRAAIFRRQKYLRLTRRPEMFVSVVSVPAAYGSSTARCNELAKKTSGVSFQNHCLQPTLGQSKVTTAKPILTSLLTWPFMMLALETKYG